MIVDCNECPGRGRSCAECVLTVLIGMPPDLPARPHAESITSDDLCLDQEEQAALSVLAEFGLISATTMVPARNPRRRLG